MATFLTTSKMDPALAARIEASVGGRLRSRSGAALSPRAVALARVGVLAAVAVVAGVLVFGRHRARQEIDMERAALLDEVRLRRASFTESDIEAAARVESWLVALSVSYEGDFVAEALRARGALRATLTRPAVYVRGPIQSFASSRGVAEAAATSVKDALLLCLVDPPASRAEKVLLGKVRTAYAGGAALEDATANVRRFQDSKVGLSFLLPPWSERVRAAAEHGEIGRLRRELERAPFERAKQAARAEVLVVALDEPDEPGGPTELDGEHAHMVRIGIVDLASAKVLLRLRKRVDPSWISDAKRSDRAGALDGCGLAFDVHEAVSAREPFGK